MSDAYKQKSAEVDAALEEWTRLRDKGASSEEEVEAIKTAEKKYKALAAELKAMPKDAPKEEPKAEGQKSIEGAKDPAPQPSPSPAQPAPPAGVGYLIGAAPTTQAAQPTGGDPAMQKLLKDKGLKK